jgi:hypothetical protein
VLRCYDKCMTKAAAKVSRKNKKIRLTQATMSELIASHKITPAELRLAERVIEEAKRSLKRPSRSVKRVSTSRATAK